MQLDLGRCALLLGLRVPSIVVLLVALSGTACVVPPPYRQVPDFETRVARVRTITLVPPKISVYVMTAGEVEEEIQEWSDAAYEGVVAAIENEVEDLGRTFVPYAGERAPRPRVDMGHGEEAPRLISADDEAHQSWLLFEAVILAVLRHTYDPYQTFPNRVNGFDYTLGPEAAAMLGGTEADAFMLIIATDHIPSRERQALIGAGLAAAAMTGGYSGPGATPANLTLALVESASGDILWFNKISMPISDLRDARTDAVLVDMVTKGLAQ